MVYWKLLNTLSVATVSRICSRLKSAGCDCQISVVVVLDVRLYVTMPMNKWRKPTLEQLTDLEETFLKDLGLTRRALQPMEDF